MTATRRPGLWGELWRLSEDGAEALGTGFRAMTFLRHSQDLLVLEGGRLLLLRKAQGEPEEEAAEGIVKPLAFALSADERTAAILLEDNALLFVDRESHATARLDLTGSGAEGVWRAEGNAVFQLNRDASAGIWLADGDGRLPVSPPFSRGTTNETPPRIARSIDGRAAATGGGADPHESGFLREIDSAQR